MIFGTDEKEGKGYGKCNIKKKYQLGENPRINSKNKKL